MHPPSNTTKALGAASWAPGGRWKRTTLIVGLRPWTNRRRLETVPIVERGMFPGWTLPDRLFTMTSGVQARSLQGYREPMRALGAILDESSQKTG